MIEPEPEDVVITVLLTTRIDPQRGKRWPADPAIVETWAGSLHGHRGVILADELETAPAGAELERVRDIDMNVYYRRWLHLHEYLSRHPEYRWVWFTDGSDVEMLHDPMPYMQRGRLYVGSEPKTVGDEWLRRRHPAQRLQRFMDEHADKTLHNAGVVGGERSIVEAFAGDMVQEYDDLQAARLALEEPPGAEVGDMGTFNLLTHTKWADLIVTGEPVHTRFRANDTTNPTAFWRPSSRRLDDPARIRAIGRISPWSSRRREPPTGQQRLGLQT
jgi:hypothetical protein